MRKLLRGLVMIMVLMPAFLSLRVEAEEPPPVPGEVTSANVVHHSAPPAFTAAPFAADFVVTGSEGSGNEHYFPSNGDGTFGARSNIPGLNSVDGLDVADMDGDGDNDFLICDGQTSEVYLYTNNGSGTFITSVIATNVASGSFCTNLRNGDFNEDGLKDFVVGDNSVQNGMFVYLQGAGVTFTKKVPGLDLSWTAIGNSLFPLAVGDIDGDGHQDILVLGYAAPVGSGEMRFYKGNGDGTFQLSALLFNIRTDFGVGPPTGLALFDLEGDGDLDVIAGGASDGSHFIYTNNGSGNFTKPTGPVFDVDNFTGIDAFDFDGDNDDDLAIVDWTNGRILYVEN